MKSKKPPVELPAVPVVEGRREFLGTCAAFAGITFVGCGAALLQGCEATTSPPQNNGGQSGGKLELDVSSLDADGKSFVTTQKGPDDRPILVARVAGEYLALSMQCSHEHFQVAPPKSDGTITCPLHGSRFTLAGAVISGPATQPLKRYTTSFDSSTNKLTITLA